MAVLDFLTLRKEDRFARRVMDRLRDLGWSKPMAYDRGEFTITMGDGGGRLFLGNIFRDWLTNPLRERARQLDQAIAFLLDDQQTKTFEEVADRLLPVVRNLRDLQAAALDGDAGQLALWQPYRVLADPLGLVLAVDLPHGVMLVSAELLKTWERTFDAAYERAMANLIARSAVRFEEAPGGFYISDYGDLYDSSRLLMPELFHALQLKGDPIAVAISRSCVVVAGSDEPAALQALQEFVVRQLPEETRPTSFLPMRLEGENWIAIDPYQRQFDAIRDLAIKGALWDYGLQKARLEAHFEKQGQDIFVVPLEFGQWEGDAHTWTSWTEHVPALLPRSEALGMTRADGRRLFRLWRDVEAVCGPFEKDATYFPARYRPAKWPQETAWNRLQTEFEAPEWGLSDGEIDGS